MEQLRATVAAANTLYRTELRKDADSAFRIMELSVDDYLDRYYIVWVKFGGTHAQYDRIDVENVNDY